MNRISFDTRALRLGHAGPSITADYEIGAVLVVDTASGEADDVARRLDLAFDPIGYESFS